MGLMLDSSVIIGAEKGEFDLKALLRDKARTEWIGMAAMTASEILHGWWRAPAGKRKRRRREFLDDILGTIPVWALDLLAARKHAELWATLQSRGQMIGAHDLIIAATCLSAGHRFATLSEREFQRPGAGVGGPGEVCSLRCSGTAPQRTRRPWTQRKARS